MKRIPLTQGKIATVSDGDCELVTPWHWSYLPHRSGYAIARVNGKKVYMHRFILNAPPGMEVDHINGDTLDNRRENLRLATRQENARNQRRHQTNAMRTRYKGVSHSGEQWSASIYINGKSVFLGRYNTDIEAAKAYDAAARERFGAFARLNFPDAEQLAAERSRVPGRMTPGESARDIDPFCGF